MGASTDERYFHTDHPFKIPTSTGERYQADVWGNRLSFLAKTKNRSAMRTWGLMLFVNVLPVLLLSVGILFTNASVWEFNCYK